MHQIIFFKKVKNVLNPIRQMQIILMNKYQQTVIDLEKLADIVQNFLFIKNLIICKLYKSLLFWFRVIVAFFYNYINILSIE